ncbi:Cse1 protein, partial [Teladorsagia circumcincta]
GETPEVDMTSEEEEQIRQSILQGMFLIRGTLQGQLSHAVQLMAKDNLKPWVEGFLEIMKMDCPGISSSAGEATFLDELKMEVCEIFTLYAQRFEEEINPFMQNIIQAVWQLVVQTGNETRFDGMVCSALEFLSIICQKNHYESYFVGEGVLQTIAQDVCVKNLHLRQEDLEMFEDEPIEYMKKDIEGTDTCTRRRGAIDLVRALCRKFEERLVPVLAQLVQSLCSDGDWIKLDVVYCLVTAIASKTETAKSGATSTSQLINVADYYAGQVRGHLSANIDDMPILKADALKFVVTFRNQLPAEVLVEVIQAADRLLTSRFTILHKYAAFAVDKLLLVKEPNSTAPLLTARVVPVGSLLNNLVSGFDKDPKAQNSPYLMKAVLRCVAILDTETLPQGNLDAELMPLIETILSQDIADLIPYALQITDILKTLPRVGNAGSRLLGDAAFFKLVQGVENPMSVLLNNMFRRVQFSKTPKFMKHFVVFLCRFAIVRGAEHFAK